MGTLFTASSFRIQVHISIIKGTSSIITTERTDALTDSIHSHDKSCHERHQLIYFSTKDGTLLALNKKLKRGKINFIHVAPILLVLFF